MAVASVRRGTAWLFTRQDESVRLEAEEADGVFRLLVQGPGEASAAHDCPSLAALERRREVLERELREGGFRLQAFVERRSDQRATSQTAERRRRH